MGQQQGIIVIVLYKWTALEVLTMSFQFSVKMGKKMIAAGTAGGPGAAKSWKW